MAGLGIITCATGVASFTVAARQGKHLIEGYVAGVTIMIISQSIGIGLGVAYIRRIDKNTKLMLEMSLIGTYNGAFMGESQTIIDHFADEFSIAWDLTMAIHK